MWRSVMVSHQKITDRVQHTLIWERLLRGGVPCGEIPELIEAMGKEHMRWINREAMEPKPCPNCPNHFDARLLEDARLNGNSTLVCQGCRSSLWLVVDEEHYGTVPVARKPSKRCDL